MTTTTTQAARPKLHTVPQWPEAVELAAIYDEATGEVTDEVRALWSEAGEWFKARAAALATAVDITRIETGQPYANGDEQIADLDAGRFTVTAEHSEHPVWGVDTNVAFRICHDIDGHYAARSGFDVLGELQAFRAQAFVTPQRFLPVLFCESLLQLASTVVNGEFPPQRIVQVPLATAWAYVVGERAPLVDWRPLPVPASYSPVRDGEPWAARIRRRPDISGGC